MEKSRYYKLFKDDRKAVILAFDHAASGNLWIDPSRVIMEVREGGFDGIMSTYGVLRSFKKEIGQMGTMVRMEFLGSACASYDVINGQPMRSPFTVDDVLRLGVDGIMTMGILGSQYDTDNIQYIAHVCAEADKYGLMTAAEMLPHGFSADPEDRSIEAMNTACRLGAEMGLDIVKTQYVGPVDEFKRVVDNCYCDILALGGAQVGDDRAVLQNARDAIDAGCKGLVIGRNVWGHKNVRSMSRALVKIVHDGASVDEALEELA